MSLGIYENWPDERWIDVTSPLWQSFVIDELGKDYAAMGLDGFFLDNADVYYHFPEDDVFQGLCTIMKGLKSYGLPLIINGGDPFVSRCMEENTALSLFDGTNQETVFTKIDFTNQTYGQQAEEETEYFQEYLSKAKEHGLSVYLLGYLSLIHIWNPDRNRRRNRRTRSSRTAGTLKISVLPLPGRNAEAA